MQKILSKINQKLHTNLMSKIDAKRKSKVKSLSLYSSAQLTNLQTANTPSVIEKRQEGKRLCSVSFEGIDGLDFEQEAKNDTQGTSKKSTLSNQLTFSNKDLRGIFL